jgi:hypothetical protein
MMIASNNTHDDLGRDGACSVPEAVAFTGLGRTNFAEAVDAIAEKKGPAAKTKILSGRSGKTKSQVIAEANGRHEEEAEQPAEEEPIEDVIRRKNGENESFCRGLMKYVELNLPSDPWLEDLNRREGALRKFQDGCTTLRSCKCTGPCPKCGGKGCRTCHDTGRLPKLNFDMVS